MRSFVRKMGKVSRRLVRFTGKILNVVLIGVVIVWLAIFIPWACFFLSGGKVGDAFGGAFIVIEIEIAVWVIWKRAPRVVRRLRRTPA